MAGKRRWVDEIVLIGNTRGFVGGLAQASFALNQVGAAVRAASQALAAPTQAALSFQTALNQVEAVSGATAGQMAAFEAQALDMGASTMFTAQQAAEAQSFLAMAGLGVREAMEALPAALSLAAAGNLELASSADLVTNVLTGYALPVSELDRAADVLATTASSANTSVYQLGEAMKYAAPVAAASGVRFEEASAALGLLANAAGQGETGGTALRGILAKLAAPTGEAQKALDRLGVSALDSSGELRSLTEIVGDFERAGLSTTDAITIFGQRAGPGMQALVSQGSEALAALTAKLEESEGAAERMAETQQRGLVGAMTEASSAAGNLQIVIGQALTPAVVAVLGAVTESARGLGAWFRESETARVASRGLGEAAAFVATNAGALARIAGVLTLAWIAQSRQVVIARGVTLAWGAAAGTARLAAAAWRLMVAGTTQAIALQRAGLLGARLATLAWSAAVGVVRGALGLLKLAIASTGIGAIVILVSTGLVLAWQKWGDKIGEFLRGVWNGFVGALETGMEWIRPLAEWAGLKLPESLGAMKFATDGAGGGLEKFSDNLEGAYEQLGRAEAGIDAMREAGQEVDPELEAWTEGLRAHITALGGTTTSADDLAKMLGDDLAPASGDAAGGVGEIGKKVEEVEKKLIPAKSQFKDFAQAQIDLAEAEKRAAEEAARHEAAVDRVSRALQGLPTKEAVAEFELVREAWAGMSADQQTNEETWKAYAARLIEAKDAGIALTGAELEVVAAAKRMAEAAKAAGEDSGSEWVAGLQGVISSKNVAAVFTRAFTGGGGMEGAFRALGTQAGGKIAEGLEARLKTIDVGGPLKHVLGAAVPVLGPALGAFAGWISGKIAGMFGPSKATVAAREGMEAFAAEIELNMDDASTSARFNDWLTGGFTRSHATIVTHFQDLALANGESAQAGVDLWTRYQRAVEEGNDEAIDAVMGQVEAWGGAAEAVEAAAAAAAAHEEAVERVAARLLGLPTDQAAADFKLLREAWDSLSPDERAEAWDRYVAELVEARDAGIALTDQELAAVAAFETYTAELDALRQRQSAELEALEARQAERLDLMRTSRDEALDLMREAQAAELEELKAAQAAELGELKAARAAALGVVEAAIARELEDERVKAQLKIDMRKAGSDAEARQAAQARADEAFARLAERDELSALMAEAEERVRARYAAELDAINAHWDEKEAIATDRHAADLETMGEQLAAALAAEESAWALELAGLEAHLAAERTAQAAAHAREVAALDAHFEARRAEFERGGAAEVAEAAKTVSAINAATSQLADRVVTITHRTVFESGAPAGVGVHPMAAGGAGVVTRPTLFLAGEAGAEEFWFSGSGRAAPRAQPPAAGGMVDVETLRRAMEGMSFRFGSDLDRIIMERLPVTADRLL